MQEELKQVVDEKIEGKSLSIINLDGGGAVELIDIAIGDVVRNCTSLNHRRKVKRQVVLKIDIEPVDENRTMVRINYDVDAKLAKRIPISEATEYGIGVDGSKGPFIKSKIHQEQGQLPGFENVRQMRKEG